MKKLVLIDGNSIMNRAFYGIMGSKALTTKDGKYTNGIFEDSNRYAQILKNKLQESNIKVNGIFERSDITGFNWSTVPVVILEMGFMSNYNEDKMLADKLYQMKLMECVSNAIDEYKNN